MRHTKIAVNAYKAAYLLLDAGLTGEEEGKRFG